MGVREEIHATDDKLKKAIDFVIRELSEIRTGRAHPGLVEGLHADYYGTLTMFKQLGQITVPDPHMVVIQPWDPAAIPEMEKAILKSNLGITPSNDGKVIRLAVPQLSKERRQEMVKIVHKKAEDGKISLRTIRHEAKAHLEKMEKDKLISEDDKFRGIDEMQKLVDKYTTRVDEILKNKEKEVLEF